MRAVLIILMLLFQDFFILIFGNFFWIVLLCLLIILFFTRLNFIEISKKTFLIFYLIFFLFFFRSIFMGISLINVLNEFLLYLILPISFFLSCKVPTRRQQHIYFYFFLILFSGVIVDYYTEVFDKFHRNASQRNFFLVGSPSNLFIYSFGLILLSKDVFLIRIKSILNFILSVLSFSRFPIMASLLISISNLKNKFFLFCIISFIIILIYFNIDQILLDPGNVGRLKYWYYLYYDYNPSIAEFFFGKGMGLISENTLLGSVHMESSFIKIFIELGVVGIASLVYIYFILIRNTYDVYYRSYVLLIFIQAIFAPMFPSIGNFVFLGFISSMYKNHALDRAI